MNTRKAVIFCALCTLVTGFVLFQDVLLVAQLTKPDVRVAAEKSITDLRSQGLWMVNARLAGIDRNEIGICLEWEHRYRSRKSVDAPETFVTCIQQ